MGAKISPWC